VKSSAKGCADAQGRGDDGLAPKKASATDPLVATQSPAEGLVLKKESHTFFGEVSEERRPWAITRERSPGRFCPALLLSLAASGGLNCGHWKSEWPGPRWGRVAGGSSSSSHFSYEAWV
jgi:hypothetical protein